MLLPAKPLLLIENEALIAIALEADLVDAGFEVVLVHNGAQGGCRIGEGRRSIFCVVTDIRLPDVDGWALGRRARELIACADRVAEAWQRSQP